MGNILSNLFSTGASTLVKTVGDTLDNLITSKEEKLAAKIALEKILLEHEAAIQKEVSARWASDMNSDSWMSKNIRPLTLAFLIVCTMFLVFIDAGSISFNVDEQWKSLLTVILTTVIAAYFGGRSYEKGKRDVK
jgi:hypothetical protein